MVSRRTFLSLLGGAAAAPAVVRAQTTSRRVALYASVGADLTHYDVDVDAAALIRRGTVTLPASVQYAWPHVSRRYLYVASSNTAAGAGATRRHASCDRVSHRCLRRAHAARQPDRAAGASDSYHVRHPFRARARRVQQSERAQGLPNQSRRDAWRRGQADRADRRRHLRPSGARDREQPHGDPGDARQRRRRRQTRRPGRAEGIQLQGRTVDEGSLDRAQTAVTVSGRVTSTFIRQNRGCTSRSSVRTRCRSTGWRAIG